MEMNRAPERVLIKRKEWAAGDAQRDSVITEAKGVVKHTNISYGPYGEFNLLDVYVPEERTMRHSQTEYVTVKDSANQELPVIVNIHGGGYFYGDKELYHLYGMDLAARGFVVVNFNYRLAPEYQFPAPIEDIHAVMKWVADNISAYNGDSQRVFVLGDSAGAQLTSHYAAIWSNPDFAALYGLDQANVRIRAVSLACGMYDIIKRATEKLDEEIMGDYLGELLHNPDERMDVLSNLTTDFPPAYLFTAVNDFLRSECEPMADLLTQLGVENTWDCYGTKEQQEVSHVFHINLKLPEAEAANNAQIAFFRAHMTEKK